MDDALYPVMRYWSILQPEVTAAAPPPMVVDGPVTMMARVPLMKPDFVTPTENLRSCERVNKG